MRAQSYPANLSALRHPLNPFTSAKTWRAELNIRQLNEISSGDVHLAGGKGANLGEMMKLGLPVPPGFCLTVDAYDAHVRAWGLAGEIAPLLKQEDWPGVERVTADIFMHRPLDQETIRELLSAYQAMGAPKVAVRSSATAEDMAEASFAGQQETMLNVSGDEALLSAVRRCWASLWSVRALSYRQQRGIEHLGVSMATVVQEMVQAESAGVLFTIDPVAQRADRLLVQATRGLGEELVSGRTTGDVYRVERGDKLKVVERDLERAGAPILDDAQVLHLSELSLRLEAHFGSPQDVEFAFAEEHIFLLQTRPVTGLAGVQPETLPTPERVNIFQRKISAFADDRYPVAPKPLDQLFFSVQLGATTHALRLLGYYVSEASERAIQGQVWRQVYMVPKLYPTWRLIKMPFLMVRTLNKDWNRFWIEPQQRLRAVTERVELEKLSDAELLERADRIMLVWAETMNRRFSFLFGVLADIMLRFIVTLAVGPRKVAGVVGDLMSGLHTRSLEVNERLWTIARSARRDPVLLEALRANNLKALSGSEAGRTLLREVDDFLDQYGQREGVTWYLSTPTWRQDPGQVWRLLRSLAEIPSPPAGTSAERSEAAVLMVSQRLRFVPGLPGLFRWLVDRLRRLQKFREDSHFDVARPLDAMQELAGEWGRRLAARGLLAQPSDIFYLSYAEVREWLRGGAPAPVEALKYIARRRATYQVINGQWQAQKFQGIASTGTQLKGVAASPGIVRAKARIIRGEHQFARLQPGEVLVCPYTSPAWTSLFASAAAVITEIGGAGSHAAIVAREYGIPAVMGISGVTNRIVDGQELLVDGNAGRVVLGEI
jgi:phosphohistidine swiveling domain-containing protein